MKPFAQRAVVRRYVIPRPSIATIMLILLAIKIVADVMDRRRQARLAAQTRATPDPEVWISVSDKIMLDQKARAGR